MKRQKLGPTAFARACRGFAATALVLALAWGAPGTARSESCQALAGRTLTWIVPYSAGGGFDIEARILAPHLGRQLAAEVVIQNVTGAGGQVGAKAIRDAAANGLTFGTINGGGLAAVELLNDAGAPTLDEFTVLGRTSTQRHVWMVSYDSPIVDAADLVERGRNGTVVFGGTDIGDAAFLSGVLGSALLGFEPELVVGYRGSADVRLALLRGEADAMSGSFESALDMLEAKELRAVLQISSMPISADPLLAGVPTLGGSDGLAAMQAAAAGADVAAAEARAAQVADITGLGRLIVAPADLPADIEACLAAAIEALLGDPAAQAGMRAARRSLDPLDAATAARVARDTVARAATWRTEVERAMARIRS